MNEGPIVKINGQPIHDVNSSSPAGLFHFFNDLHQNGLFHALFGETVHDFGVHVMEGIVNGSDILIFVACLELLFVMFGAKWAPRWLYWTGAVYVVIKIIGKLVLV